MFCAIAKRDGKSACCLSDLISDWVIVSHAQTTEEGKQAQKMF